MKLNAVIIDDEPMCRHTLRQKLKKCDSSINIVAETSSLKQSITYLKDNKATIDVLFLDIEMPDGTGFDLLKALGPNNLEVIFTTSHHRLALNSFEYNVTDFLIKPIKENSLKRAIQKVKKRRFFADSNRAGLAYEPIHFDKVGFPTLMGMEFVSIKNITYCEAAGSYTTINIKEQKDIIVSRNLLFIERKLPEEVFFRVNRSNLINLAHVKSYQRSGHIVMEDGTIITVSKSKRDDLLNFLGATT